jgi:hypothetical protein
MNDNFQPNWLKGVLSRKLTPSLFDQLGIGRVSSVNPTNSRTTRAFLNHKYGNALEIFITNSWLSKHAIVTKRLHRLK